MVFPSVSVYLDPPNWNQHHRLPLEQQQGQQAHQPGRSGGRIGGVGEIPGQFPPRVVNAVTSQSDDAAAGLVRPVPMADRARLAKIPQPGPVLNCPRCDSTNTKFCYYNNYSLSQPRHFCKNCRRYWTRGGALRNVPVGGGCRRNKRTKSSGGGSSSKSSTATDRQASTASSLSSTATSAAISSAITSSIPLQQQLQLPFISSWNSLSDLPNLGLGFTAGIQQIYAGDYSDQVRGNSCFGMESLRLHHQIQQFPFGLDPPQIAPQTASLPVLYPLTGEGSATDHGGGSLLEQIQAKLSNSAKMEDGSQQSGLSFTRQYLELPRAENLWAGSGSGSSNGLLGDGSFRF